MGARVGRSWRRAFSGVLLALLLAGPAAAAENAYKTIPAFMDLFEIFPRGEGAGTIASALAKAMPSGAGSEDAVSPTGPLVLVNEYGVFVYDGTTRAKITGLLTRDDPASGFYEMTALSHVGPAIAYLAALNEAKSTAWPALLATLLERVRAAREANRQAVNGAYWVTQVDAPSWQSHADAIDRMVDYGLWMAGDYLVKVQKGDPADFTQANVGSRFYEGGDPAYPIPFNNVMIATFMLVALNSTDRLRTMVETAGDAIDWTNARVVVHMPIGTNYGAGLTLGTNQLAAGLLTVADGALPRENLLIAPYAAAPCPGEGGCPLSVFAAETLDAAVFDFYATQVWGGIHNRTRIAASAFPGVESIALPAERPALPGDYGVTAADDIAGFVQRLKLSLIDDRELLSNAVGYWVPGALRAAGWNPAKMEIPGLTTGFPPGVTGYPPSNPEIPR
jgi:hypothetical protein